MTASSTQTVHSVGYEGETVNDFIQKLKNNNIKYLIDVRELPLSRKKGFSKTELRNILNGNSIEYFNIKELGSPRDIRHDYWQTKDFDTFRIEYLDYIKNQETKISELLLCIKNYSKNGNVAIMCFEKDHTRCHRSLLLEYIKNKLPRTIKVWHI